METPTWDNYVETVLDFPTLTAFVDHRHDSLPKGKAK